MGIGLNALTLAAVLKFHDELSQPLDTAIKGAKRQMDDLSVTGQKVQQIKLFDGLKDELANLGKALEEAKRKRDFFMNSAEMGGENGARLFARDISDAREEVVKLADQIDAKRREVDAMAGSLRASGADMDNLGEHLAKLDAQFAREQGIKAFKDRLDEIGRKTVDAGHQIESIGIRIGALGAGANAGLRQANLDMQSMVVNAVKAEDALYGIATTAGLSGQQAREAVARWNSQVNQIARDTNKTQAEVISAMQDLISKGLNPQTAVDMLGPIGKAASAAKADIQDLASAANAAYQNMGVESKRALEIMAQGGKEGAFELRDMAQYFDALTTKSKLLGSVGSKGLAELAAAAQIARKGAGDASVAANNLQNFLDKLSAPVTAKAFEKFGLNLTEEVKKGLASGDLIGYMGELIQRVSQGDAAKISQLFADVQAKNFIAPLVQNLDEYKRIRDSALNAEGVVAKDFDTVMQSTAQQFQSMQISASTAVNESQGLKDIVTTLKDLSAWVAEHPDLAKWIIFGTAGTLATGAVVSAVGATVTAIGSLIPAMGTVATFLAANPVVATLLGVGAAAVGGFAIGTWLSGQIDEAVAAVTGQKGATLGTALYDLIEGENGIVPMLKTLPERVGNTIERWKEVGGSLVQALRDGITDRLKGALGIGEKLTEGVAYIKSTAAQWVQVGRDIIQGLIDGIVAKAGEVVQKIRGMGSSLVRELKDLLGIKSPSKVFAVIGEDIGEGLKLGIVRKVDDVHAAAKQLGTSAIYGMKTQLGADWLKGQLKDYDDLAKAIDKERQKAESEAGKAREKLLDEGRRLTDALRDEMDRAFDDMERYRELLEQGAISWDTYGKAVAQATLRIKAVDQATDGVVQTTKAASATTRDWMGRYLSTDAAKAAEEMAQRTGQSLTDAIMRGFEDGRGVAENFVKTLKDMFAALVLRPIIQPIAAGAASVVTGMLMPGAANASPMGAAASSFASSLLGQDGIGMIGNIMSADGMGILAGGIAESFGASSAIAGSIGSFVSTAVPIVGALGLLASLVGKQPSGKYAYGSLDLGTGGVFDRGSQTGEKYSAENNQAVDAALTAAKGYLDILKGMGATVTGAHRISVGDTYGYGLDVGRGGVGGYKTTDLADFMSHVFDALVNESVGLDAALKGLLTTFEGSAEEAATYASGLKAVNDYIKSDLVGDAAEQVRLAGRSAYQAWQDAGVQAGRAMVAFDGGLKSAQDLANATQAMYQAELSVVGQIQGMLQSTGQMFAQSIRQIDMSVMDSAAKYDYLRNEVDQAYSALRTASDPQAIGQLADEINRLTLEAYGLLDKDQQAAVASQYTDYLRNVNDLTAERLNAAQAAVEQQHANLVADIRSAMGAVAERMEAAAAAQQAAASTPVRVDNRVTVDVNVDTPASVEVGYA